MKAQVLQNLSSGSLRFGAFLRLVFIRVTRVVALCLVLTLTVYLLWQGNFTLGSFLAGATFGLVAFSTWRRLRHHTSHKAEKPDTAVTEQTDGAGSSAETRPKS